MTSRISSAILCLWTVSSLLLGAASGTASAARSPQAQASQSKVTVKGTVKDAHGVPVVGAAVIIRGQASQGGQITDLDGNFSITVPQGSVLEVSCMGYVTYQLKAASDAAVAIVLEEDSQLLSEVVVVGYGTQRKESVVGAITQISTEEIVSSGTTNVTNAIAGKLSGVQTYQKGGQPGADNATILIRGVSSWNGSAPLVMVDGVERDFNSIDPNEIETLSVLKDASATAVYGAKGANGVILVTTRTGNEGKASMHLTVEAGVSSPTRLPDHISSYDVGLLANEAMKNSGKYSQLFSDAILAEYRHPSSRLNSIRYPDTDFYDLLINDFVPNVNANFNMSGGSKKVKYFVSAGYSHDGSLLKQLYDHKDNKYGYNRLNYRTNLDISLTSTTKLSLKAGGSTGIQQYSTGGGASTDYLFTYLFKASPLMYPAYYPTWMLDEVPDPDQPNNGQRATTASSGIYKSVSPNPYQYFGVGSFQQDVDTKLFVDLIVDQKLDFITKGLRFNAKASLTSSFSRTAKKSSSTVTQFKFNWDTYDSGTGNPWELLSGSTGEIYVVSPYGISHSNALSTPVFTYNLEGSLNYDRSFSRHNVTGLLLYHQREYNKNASFPKRTQGVVARATYDYDHKYLFEANMGLTGSEQFARTNRYGFFPSLAVGYYMSKEQWWKSALPWWNKMKVRYSNGLVGSDAAPDSWLYYSSYTKSGSLIYEDKAANTSARWETAHKQDLGFEMAFFKDLVDISLDLYDEKRSGMLITPVESPLMGMGSKAVNRGAMKKHGLEIEANVHRTLPSSFYWEVGAMASFTENRVTAYEEAIGIPEWQKQQGKPFEPETSGHYLNGMNHIDNGFFNTIDEIHGYPSVVGTNWDSLFPGIYKVLDYDNDGAFTSNDLHAIDLLPTPKVTGSFHVNLGYKGLSMRVLFYGNYGRRICSGKAIAKEFGRGDYLIHTSQLNYWTPDNASSATHSALSFNDDAVYAALGGSFNAEYTMMLEDVTYVKADYLQLKEVYLGYNFNKDKVRKSLGIGGLNVNITANNLWCLTNLVEGEPQYTRINWITYPVMASVKLGIKASF